jgi:hypothetical protein
LVVISPRPVSPAPASVRCRRSSRHPFARPTACFIRNYFRCVNSNISQLPAPARHPQRAAHDHNQQNDRGHCARQRRARRRARLPVGLLCQSPPWQRTLDAERHTHKATTWAPKELWAKVASECLERTGTEGAAPEAANRSTKSNITATACTPASTAAR